MEARGAPAADGQLFERKRSQTQDPDSQTESGAPFAYFSFRTKNGVEAINRPEKSATNLIAGHSPVLGSPALGRRQGRGGSKITLLCKSISRKIVSPRFAML